MSGATSRTTSLIPLRLPPQMFHARTLTGTNYQARRRRPLAKACPHGGQAMRSHPLSKQIPATGTSVVGAAGPIERALACWVVRATEEGSPLPRFRFGRCAAQRARVGASRKLSLHRLLDHALKLLARHELNSRI